MIDIDFIEFLFFEDHIIPLSSASNEDALCSKINRDIKKSSTDSARCGDSGYI